MGLQVLFAVLILKTAPGEWAFRKLSDGFARLIGFTDDGAKFVWGWIYKNPQGQAAPIFMIDILMTIVFFAALMSLLYHLGIMQGVIAGIAKVMRKTMGTSGSETLSAAANIFVGQTEAPLVVKPFVETMTLSELHAVMVGGFATIAGGVLAAYVSFGVDAGHLVAASFMSAPAALVAAKMFYPETAESVTAGELKVKMEKTTANVFDAVCVGAADGMKLVLNVVAMLLAFVALIAMINAFLGLFVDGLTLERIFGYAFAPVAWILGVPWDDCLKVGQLLGTRMVVNEFKAYIDLMGMDVSPRAYVIATYAFCGFANFGSIAIQIGGISTIAPSRRADLARLGLRAMLAGTLASFLTANIAGALLSDEQVERDYRLNKARVARTDEEWARQRDEFLRRFPGSSYAGDFEKVRRK
jgi:CNT family concentrative nucleoside transporter